jgi:chloramphenicol O-acetyltransferase type B
MRVHPSSYANRLTVYCWKPGYTVTIGAYCSIAEDVVILLGGDHDLDWVSTFPFLERWKPDGLSHLQTPKSRGDVVLGNDVWLAHGATILSGTTINDGAVVAAGSIVRGEVPAYAIVGGNPWKIIRYRFEAPLRAALEDSKWWTLPEDTLRRLIPYMGDPSSFIGAIDAHRPRQ